MFNTEKKQVLQELTNQDGRKKSKSLLSVIDNFNQIIAIHNGWYITKDKKVTFVFQLDNINYQMMSHEEQNQVLRSFQNYIQDFDNRDSLNEETVLNQYVFKVPYKLDLYEKQLNEHIQKAQNEKTYNILMEEAKIIENINYNAQYCILSTFLTFSMPLGRIKQMYSVLNEESINKLFKSLKQDFNDISFSEFKDEDEFIHLFLCNLYQNNMEYKTLNFQVDNSFDYEALLEKKKINQNYKILNQLYAFLPSSIKFEKNHVKTNGNSYHGFINITGYPSYLSDCWGETIHAIANNNNNYVEDISIKMSIDKSESYYYSQQINAEFLKAERKYEEGAPQMPNYLRKIMQYSPTKYNNKVATDYNDFFNLGQYVEQGGLILNVFCTIHFTCDSLDNLTKAYRYINSQLKVHGYNTNTFEFQMNNVYNSWLDSSQNWLHTNKTITPYETLTNSVVPGFLANTITANVDNDQYASFLGENDSGLPVTLSLFNNTSHRTNHGVFITGDSGNGKSSLIKKIARNNAVRGIKQFFLDIEGEYLHLVSNLSNNYIISFDKTNINPLNLLTDDAKNHQFVHEFMSLLLNKDKNDRSVILLIKTWTQLQKKLVQQITISDIVKEIKTIIEYEQFSLSENENQLTIDDLNLLSQIKDKFELDFNNEIFTKLFNTKTNVDIEKLNQASTICFDMSIIKTLGGDAYARAYSHMIINFLDNAVLNTYNNNSEQPQLIIVDEVHLYMNQNPYLINWFNKRAGDLRKRNAGLVTATQNIKDVINSLSKTNNRKIIDDSTYKIFFKTDEVALNWIKANNPILQNNEQLQNQILQLRKHNCIVFLGTEVLNLKVAITKQEFQDFGKVGK